MKAIFPLLLCYVLMTSQSYALSGGPSFGGNNSVNPLGTFSGVLTPDVDAEEANVINSLGLFNFRVPTTGLATGDFLLFANGTTFNGTITASVDADSGAILGVLSGNYEVLRSVNTGTNSTTFVYAILANASGKLNGKIKASKSNAVSTARLKGSALLHVIDYTSVDPDTGNYVFTDTPYTISGFRQSLTATAATSTGTATGTTGGGSTN